MNGIPWSQAETIPARVDVRELIGCAMLAPSTRGARPWRFRDGHDWVDLLVDRRAWEADPGRETRELQLSTGAALENVVLAAEHQGFRCDVQYFPDDRDPAWIARVCLTPDPRPRSPSLFAAIPFLRTPRDRPSGDPIDPGLLEDLVAVAWDSGIRAVAITDADEIRRVGGLVVRSGGSRGAGPVPETGLGILGRLTIPARAAIRPLDPDGWTNRRDPALMERASALLVLLSAADDPLARVRTGRAMQRTLLLATQLGLTAQPVAAALEVETVSGRIADSVGMPDLHPQRLFRLGRAVRTARPMFARFRTTPATRPAVSPP